jgi:hypothetical protein
MASKDRFSFNYRCPKCGKVGTVDYSENNSRWTPFETSVDGISEGFRYTTSGSSAAPSHAIWCTGCDVVAPEYHPKRE